MKYFEYAEILTDDDEREYSGLTFSVPDIIKTYGSELIAVIISDKNEIPLVKPFIDVQYI